MLTTEPLDTANIVDVPTNLSTPFNYLTNSDTDDADDARTCAAPISEHCPANIMERRLYTI
jgi:hypothetical protein